MTDTIDTEALRALVDGATEGPWVMETMRHVYVGNRADGRTSGLWSIVHTSDDDLGDLTEAARDRVMNDAAFIAAARTAVPALLDALAEREGEVARLRRWKDEALPVMAGLQDLGRVLGLRLGTRITGDSAADAARTLVARADAAEAKVRAVEGMCDNSDDDRRYWGHDYGGTISTDRLRAALATPEPTVLE